MPGSPSAGTTFIYGHACLKTLCAFNHLFQLKQGDQIQIDTDVGAIAYRITAGPVDVQKSAQGIGADGDIYKYGVSNRLVLVTCGYGADGSSTYNVAVIAEVVTATPS